MIRRLVVLTFAVIGAWWAWGHVVRPAIASTGQIAAVQQLRTVAQGNIPTAQPLGSCLPTSAMRQDVGKTWATCLPGQTRCIAFAPASPSGPVWAYLVRGPGSSCSAAAPLAPGSRWS